MLALTAVVSCLLPSMSRDDTERADTVRFAVFTPVESRDGGVIDIDIDLDDASGFAGGVNIECQDNDGIITDLSAVVNSVAVKGDTVTVTVGTGFNNVSLLPDGLACIVQLDCGASVCIRTLEGDIDRNGFGSAGDKMQIKAWVGDVATATNAGFDYNTDGIVTFIDFALARVCCIFETALVPDCP